MLFLGEQSFNFLGHLDVKFIPLVFAERTEWSGRIIEGLEGRKNRMVGEKAMSNNQRQDSGSLVSCSREQWRNRIRSCHLNLME